MDRVERRKSISANSSATASAANRPVDLPTSSASSDNPRAHAKRGAAAQAKRGADLATEVEIPFTTAILGGEVQLSMRRATGETETIVVKIPVGIEEGKKIRLRGQGEPAPARGGTAGDILITVRVGTHPFFSRRGNNLDVKVPVTLAEAALGAKIDIPTPKGTIVLRVPAGTSSGRKLRVKGRGVAPKGVDPGDSVRRDSHRVAPRWTMRAAS